MRIPLVDVKNDSGGPFDWSALWQRRNLLLLFPHPDCESCERVLEVWRERREVLAAENTVPLVVVREAEDRRTPGIGRIVDADGRLAERLGVPLGTVVAADRFFDVLKKEEIHSLGPEEAASDSIGWISLAERQCPECGIGTW